MEAHANGEQDASASQYADAHELLSSQESSMLPSARSPVSIVLPLTSSEPSIIKGGSEHTNEGPTASGEYEDSEHSSGYSPAPDRDLQYVTGNGPVPTTQGNIGEAIGGAPGTPNGG